MNPYLAVTLAGAELWLLADKAVYYPAERSLLIADAHFGKAAAYRKLGQPVPHGTTQENLRRLDSLLNTYPCDHLIFLGDFLHAPESHAAGTLAALEQWRAERSTLRITLIRGNHDKRAGDPLGIWTSMWCLNPCRWGHLPCNTSPIRTLSCMCSQGTFTLSTGFMAGADRAYGWRASTSASASACYRPSASSQGAFVSSQSSTARFMSPAAMRCGE